MALRKEKVEERAALKRADKKDRLSEGTRDTKRQRRTQAADGHIEDPPENPQNPAAEGEPELVDLVNNMMASKPKKTDLAAQCREADLNPKARSARELAERLVRQQMAVAAKPDDTTMGLDAAVATDEDKCEDGSSTHGASGADSDCLISIDDFRQQIAGTGPGGAVIANVLSKDANADEPDTKAAEENAVGSETAEWQAELKKATAELAQKQATLASNERDEERYLPKSAMQSLMNRIRELQIIKETYEEKIEAKEKEHAEVQNDDGFALACLGKLSGI